MFKKYFNKMMGREEYKVKLTLLPVTFTREADYLKLRYDAARMGILIEKVEKLHNLQGMNPAIKERAANTGMFLRYLNQIKNKS